VEIFRQNPQGLNLRRRTNTEIPSRLKTNTSDDEAHRLKGEEIIKEKQ
jgi:hypothetical protein